ncbi:hypothetical protein E6O75_ATG08474 [Venturia nashicola]|uniref:Uncharacterized protein n=1 Tax=Venturia nashicola TaxID=86259 RepID=A0A4Z1NKH1_9PEZI|nr:hypothetical protein E6O75_ATG08474 [Venturia nashicola]
MCDYTQVEYTCTHTRYTVRAWCIKYQETHKRCPANVTAIEYRLDEKCGVYCPRNTFTPSFQQADTHNQATAVIRRQQKAQSPFPRPLPQGKPITFPSAKKPSGSAQYHVYLSLSNETVATPIAQIVVEIWFRQGALADLDSYRYYARTQKLY